MVQWVTPSNHCNPVPHLARLPVPDLAIGITADAAHLSLWSELCQGTFASRTLAGPLPSPRQRLRDSGILQWIHSMRKKRNVNLDKIKKSFPDGSDSKESTCNAGDMGLVPGFSSRVLHCMANHCSIFT